MSLNSTVGGILSDLRDSCFGSDEFEAYSANYSWLSNQMAHTMMGFFLAVAAAWMPLPDASQKTTRFGRTLHQVHVAWTKYPWLRFLVPFLIPIIKLPFDALVIGLTSYGFPVRWYDFWDDKLTDLNFWFLGMLLAQVVMIGWKGTEPLDLELRESDATPRPIDTCAFVRRMASFVFLSIPAWFLKTWLGRTFRSAASVLFLTIPRWFWPCRRCLWRLILFPSVVLLGFINYQRWTGQKQIFDRSYLPSGWTRLCQFNTQRAFPDPNSNEARNEMMKQTRRYLEYIESESPPVAVHCVIFGGWPVNRSNLAVALGTEFAARNKTVQYFTASKLLEGPHELDRWKRRAERDKIGGPFTISHPYHPRCVIIDDLPGVFPEPLTDEEQKLEIEKRSKITCPVNFNDKAPYDRDANSRAIFEYFHCNRDHISTIWVLSCRSPDSTKWQGYIRDYFGWGIGLSDEESQKRIISIDLGNSEYRPVINRGP